MTIYWWLGGLGHGRTYRRTTLVVKSLLRLKKKIEKMKKVCPDPSLNFFFLQMNPSLIKRFLKWYQLKYLSQNIIRLSREGFGILWMRRFQNCHGVIIWWRFEWEMHLIQILPTVMFVSSARWESGWPTLIHILLLLRTKQVGAASMSSLSWGGSDRNKMV